MSTEVYAVIRTGGKQYRVTPGQRLVVERLDGERGDEIAFEDVLLVRGEDGAVAVGAPTLEQASVKAEIADQRRGRKIAVFKYKSKTRYRRLRGHRQQQTHLRISEIALGEQSWTWTPPAPTPDIEPDEETETEAAAPEEPVASAAEDNAEVEAAEVEGADDDAAEAEAAPAAEGATANTADSAADSATEEEK